MDRRVDLAVSIRSRFSLVDLAEVAPRATVSTTAPEALLPDTLDRWRLDPESFLPAYPDEIQHQNLTSLLLDFQRTKALLSSMAPPNLLVHSWEGEPRKDSEWLRKKMLRREIPNITEENLLNMIHCRQQIRLFFEVGSRTCSVSYPENLLTLTCFDCNRPLALFTLTVQEEEAPLHGWCPMCLLRKEWRKEVGAAQAAARGGGHKIPTEAEVLRSKEQHYLSSWRSSDMLFWDEQKATQSSLYCRWRDRTLLKLALQFGTAN